MQNTLLIKNRVSRILGSIINIIAMAVCINVGCKFYAAHFLGSPTMSWYIGGLSFWVLILSAAVIAVQLGCLIHFFRSHSGTGLDELWKQKNAKIATFISQPVQLLMATGLLLASIGTGMIEFALAASVVPAIMPLLWVVIHVLKSPKSRDSLLRSLSVLLYTGVSVLPGICLITAYCLSLSIPTWIITLFSVWSFFALLRAGAGQMVLVSPGLKINELSGNILNVEIQGSNDQSLIYKLAYQAHNLLSLPAYTAYDDSYDCALTRITKGEFDCSNLLLEGQGGGL